MKRVMVTMMIVVVRTLKMKVVTRMAVMVATMMTVSVSIIIHHSRLCPSTAGCSPQPESSSFLRLVLSLIMLHDNVISPTVFVKLILRLLSSVIQCF